MGARVSRPKCSDASANPAEPRLSHLVCSSVAPLWHLGEHRKIQVSVARIRLSHKTHRLQSLGTHRQYRIYLFLWIVLLRRDITFRTVVTVVVVVVVAVALQCLKMASSSLMRKSLSWVLSSRSSMSFFTDPRASSMAAATVVVIAAATISRAFVFKSAMRALKSARVICNHSRH